MDKKIKYFTKAPEKKDKRVLRFIGSDEKLDRDNEIVMSSGWKLAEYKKNPVVMVNHRHMELPVAKTEKVWVSKKNKTLMFDIKFPEPEISSIGDTLYKLYSNGYMNATSVGFKPNRDKIDWGDGDKTPYATFNEQELLELSLVSVPANPRALIQSKGIKDAIEAEVIDDLELNELDNWIKELFPEDSIEENSTEDTDDLEDDQETQEKSEQTTNDIVYCHKCGKDINQDDPDSDYLDELFDGFLNPKGNVKEDEKISLTDELLKEYFDKE